MKPKTNELSQFLKEAREKSGLSQKEVATRLGYKTSQFISNWERGISQPPIETLKSLSDFYSVSAENVFTLLLKETVKQVESDLKKKFFSTK